MRAVPFVIAIALGGWGGCGGPDVPCMNMGMPGALAQQAQLLRLDVYDADVHCDGASVQAGAPPPSQSKASAGGQPIHLDIPSGAHTLLLSAFADAAGTQLLATSCQETTLDSGGSVCFDLTLVALPDLATDNDARATCTASPDDCPVGQYCASDGQCAAGCKSAADCMGGGAAKLCDVGAHRCVECLGPNDCPAGMKCSPSGSCVIGCDVSSGSNCPGAQMCCSSLCIDTTMDISSCGACGRTCSSTNVATPGCASSLCAPVCTNGFGDCNHPVAPNADDGCETNLHDVAHCGGCTNVCNLMHATATCPSGTCQVASCNANYFDCDGTASNGCECTGKNNGGTTPGCCPGKTCQTAHTTGRSMPAPNGQFFDCETMYSLQLATDAAQAYDPNGTIFPGTCPGLSGSTVSIVCNRNSGGTQSVAWAYADTAATNPATGHTSVKNSNGCQCPLPTDLPWN
jgi:hypothetical protein